MNIIVKEIKEFLRDKSNLFFFMLFPIALIFLLGNLLISMDKAEDAVGQIKIQYLVETTNPYQIAAIQSFVEAASDQNNIAFEKSDNLETSKKLAGLDEITAAVVFSGDPMTIQVYEGTNLIQNRAVSAILNGFVQSDKAITTLMQISPDALSGLNSTKESYIKQKDLGVNRSMLDYYAISMVAMISFMSMIVGAGAFTGERSNKTINRLIIAPQNRVFLFLQKIVGMILQVALQIAGIMIISVFVFKAHYAATLATNLYLFFMFFIVTLSMVSIGTVIGLLIKANPTAVIMPFLWIIMFLGGTFSKEINIKGVTDAMPIYQIQQSAFDLTIFGRFDKVNNVILIYFVIMVIALTVGAFLFSRKEEER